VCVCVCVRSCVCLYVRAFVCMLVCVYMCERLYVCVGMSVCVCVCVCVRLRLPLQHEGDKAVFGGLGGLLYIESDICLVRIRVLNKVLDISEFSAFSVRLVSSGIPARSVKSGRC
jgi:hypothetical protein